MAIRPPVWAAIALLASSCRALPLPISLPMACNDRAADASHTELRRRIALRVAQAHGANERAESGEVLRHGLVLSLVAGVLLAAARAAQ